MRNLIVCIAGLSGMLFSMAPEAATLTTSTYLIKISANCEEGGVVCDDITYVGTHRKNKKNHPPPWP